MILNDFLYFLKQCKSSNKMTGFIGIVLCRYNENTFRIVQREEKVCSKCHTDLSKQEIGIEVIFNKPIDSLTIFQVGMLFMIFIMKQKPYDYANYHTCQSGKEFIDNIKSIRVLP